MTTTIPSVKRIRPKFRNTIKQHIPFIFGQKGFGTVVIITLDFLLRPVFVVLACDSAMEITLLGLELYRLKNFC